MNDFDRDLRQRLQRLEAAVPELLVPLTPLRPRRRAPRRGQVVLALAAVLGLVVGSAIVASGTAPPRTPEQVARDAADEERVLEDLAEHEGEVCLTADEAAALYRTRLDALGLQDWTIRALGISEAPCVGAGVSGETHEVLLTPSMGGTVNESLETLKLDLLSRCLGAAEALDLLRTTLESAGVDDPRIAVRSIHELFGPPVGVPGPPDGDEALAYLQHIEDGCVVFGDAQTDGVGRYTWTLRTR